MVHERVLVCVEGQHGVAVHPAVLEVLPARPQPGNPKRRSVCRLNAGGHRLAAAPVGFKNGVRRDDATLVALECVSKAGFLSRCLAAAVVGVAGDLGVGGPVGHQAEEAGKGF